MKHVSCLLILGLLLTSGCARRISQNYYSSASVGEAAHTYKGTIVSARKVNIGKEQLQDNTAGIAVGAVAGGVAGSQIGKGSGSVLAAAGGALLGGIAGAFAEDELSKQTGMEYSVQLDNGQVMTVVQGDEEIYHAGQRVLVIVAKKGRSRIVPDQTAAPAPVYRAAPAPQLQQVNTQSQQPQKTAPRTHYVPQEGVYYVNTNKN